jgi:hypothetical protein
MKGLYHHSVQEVMDLVITTSSGWKKDGRKEASLSLSMTKPTGVRSQVQYHDGGVTHVSDFGYTEKAKKTYRDQESTLIGQKG